MLMVLPKKCLLVVGCLDILWFDFFFFLEFCLGLVFFIFIIVSTLDQTFHHSYLDQ